MTNLDQAIRQALSAEDAEFLARFEADSPIRAALGTFTGAWGALNIFAAFITLLVFGALVWCAWSALHASDAREAVLWSAGAIVATVSLAMLKMYFWMEINKNAVLREVKRLELQVARLASRG